MLFWIKATLDSQRKQQSQTSQGQMYHLRNVKLYSESAELVTTCAAVWLVSNRWFALSFDQGFPLFCSFNFPFGSITRGSTPNHELFIKIESNFPPCRPRIFTTMKNWRRPPQNSKRYHHKAMRRICPVYPSAFGLINSYTPQELSTQKDKAFASDRETQLRWEFRFDS